MRPAQNRVYRIERARRQFTDVSADTPESREHSRHEEIMAALDDIRERMPAAANAAPNGSARCEEGLLEVRKVKAELKQIHDAIMRTKKEIATLYRGERKGVEIKRVTNELDAIVIGTEQATESILQAAERIDTDATDLVSVLKQSANHAVASDIQDQVVKIFEACNFQDLTGQRITKVVTAFSFIEERVARMMEIWGGLESFGDIGIKGDRAGNGDAGLLNGPALEGDEGIASQDDIDALFD